MFDNLINKMLVSTECILIDDNREYGTGVLIPALSDEYDFVFTALHCLKGKNYSKENKFNLYSNLFGKIDCIDEKVYSNTKLDIAVVKVKKVLGNIWMALEVSKEREPGFFIGFPQYQDKNQDKSEKIHIDFVDDTTIKVHIGQLNIGRHNKPVEVLGGFSGSPVFIEKYNMIYFSGVVVELGKDKFVFNNLSYISTIEFIHIIDSNNLGQIRTEDSDFLEACLTKIFVSHEAEELYSYLRTCSKKLNGLKIEHFQEWLQEKMFLPYGVYPIGNKDVWIGWLKFLTYMYIISNDNYMNSTDNVFDEAKFLDYIKKTREDGLKYFHSYDCETFQDLLPLLYTNHNIYKDLKCGDAIIANFGVPSPIKSHITRKQIPNVVKNIACLDNELQANEIDITSPSVNKSLDLLHIYHFEREIVEKWDYETTIRELKKKIKLTIEEVINNVRGV